MDIDKNELLRQIKFLEAKLDKDSKERKTPEDLIQDIKLYGDVPQNLVSHQHKLLFHLQKPPKTQMDLLPPDALLGLVKDSKTLFLLQKDNEILNRFFDMGQRNEGIMDLFNSLYYSWWQQLRMTVTLGATERKLQSLLEPDTAPFESFSFLEKKKIQKMAKKGDLFSQLKNMTEGGKTYE